MKKNSSIIVCGKKFDCGSRVVLWNEEEGLSFYPYKKYMPRNVSLATLRDQVDSFFIHHSATYTAHSMYRGLQARGLSCNFMIDDDENEDGCSTIYQCLDIKDYGYSQGSPWNAKGPGVELSYHPDAWDHPDRYSLANRNKWGVHEHETMSESIHGMNFSQVFKPTEAQIKACINLIRGFKKAFPDLILEFPKDKSGEILNTTVNNPINSKGLLYHLHVRRDKIDPMGFPGKRVEREVQRLAELDRLQNKTFMERLFAFVKK